MRTLEIIGNIFDTKAKVEVREKLEPREVFDNVDDAMNYVKSTAYKKVESN